jgi:hypothetical protein
MARGDGGTTVCRMGEERTKDDEKSDWRAGCYMDSSARGSLSSVKVRNTE